MLVKRVAHLVLQQIEFAARVLVASINQQIIMKGQHAQPFQRAVPASIKPLHHLHPMIALAQIVQRDNFNFQLRIPAQLATFVRRDMRFQQRQRLVLHVREKPTKRRMLLQQ